MITKRILEKLEKRTALTYDETAQLIGDLCNGGNMAYMKTAENLQFQHRFIQNEIFKFVYNVIMVYADLEEQGRYDARNEWAVKLAKELKETITNFVLQDDERN